MMMSMVSKQIEELRKYARKWSEWNGFNAAMPVLPSTNIRLLRSAADTIEALNRLTGEWISNHDGSWNCSECGLRVFIYAKGNYCPNCGARMNNNDSE